MVLWKPDFFNIYVMGDISKKKGCKELQLYVPRKYIGSVIGNGGKHVKWMAEKMNVRRIQVLPFEEKPED